MPDERARILAGAAARLTEEVSELSVVVGKLGDRLQDTEEMAKANTRRVKSNERKANLLRTLLVFDMVLTVMGFVLGWMLFETNSRIDTMCPLYTWAIGSYAPQSRSAGPDRDQYIQWFEGMRTKFAGLDCGPAYPIVPGAAHPPAASPGVLSPGN
jgi:hypothetical protein